jgi:radical SAM superfamily enzyme YgiQ (UPF0313 family)
VNDVCGELRHLSSKYSGRFAGAFFNEEAHNANAEWLAQFAERLIWGGLNRYRYDAMCGYWTFTEELISLLARAGYIQIRMGLESFSPAVGKAIHKRVDPDKMRQVLGWCKKYGIRTYLTTLVGGPGSSWEGDQSTLDILWDFKRNNLMGRIQHSIATPNPGTQFWYQAIENNWLGTDDLSKYNWNGGVVSYPNYSASQIQAMYSKFCELD